MSEKCELSLVVRYLSEECTEKEKKLIQDRMQKDQNLKELIRAMQKVWHVREKSSVQEEIDVAWLRLKSQMELLSQEKKHKSFRYFSWRFTRLPIFAFSVPVKRSLQYAMLSLFIGGSFLLFKNFQNSANAPQDQFQIVTVNNCQRLDLSLEDGTHIKLDAGSQLKFPTKFTNSREVYLKGEGYFEVMHDSTRPFCVHANHAMIRVLGTKFNIRAWKENPTVAVTVTEGSVTLSTRDDMNQKAVIIPKGYYSSLAEQELPSTPTQIDVQSSLGWMHNEIHFKDASVREVLAQLRRWYDFTFDIADHSLLEKRITVHIRMTNIDDVLELISILTNSKIIKDDKIITIKSKH